MSLSAAASVSYPTCNLELFNLLRRELLDDSCSLSLLLTVRNT